MGEVVRVDGLVNAKYARVLCYPTPTEEEVKRRVEELKRLGVEALEFTGGKQVGNIKLLGKGFAGVVVLAHLRDGSLAALKIRRVDAPTHKLMKEADALRMANRVGVGPKLLGATENLLLMEYIQGVNLPQWVKSVENPELIRRTLRTLLTKCRRLDEIGLDHGELSWAPKHVIVDGSGEPRIIDFESASDRRRPSNVTSISQYLFIRSQVAETLAEKLGKVPREALLDALREYKRNPTEEKFQAILRVCRL